MSVHVSAEQIAARLGGEVRLGKDGPYVAAPGPGHSVKDRSLIVTLVPSAPDGFLVHSHSDKDRDAIALKDYVREKASLPAFQPKTTATGANGSRLAPSEEVAARRAAATARAAAALAKGAEPAAKEVATYDYIAADGSLLYQVVRYEPKAFRQRRPDGCGGWITHKVFEGVSRIVYRLADLAKYPDGTVFVTEGEKDADNVAALGLCATTVAGGVWTPDCKAPLAGRDVLILEHNDKTGREKALEAATALHGIAKSIRIVPFTDLPAKGDVSDWIALDPERHDADALTARCLAAPPWQPGATLPAVADTAAPTPSEPLGEWDAGDDDRPIPPRGWLLGNTFCRRYVSSVIAEGGTGKTALRTAQLLSLAAGRALTGEHVFARSRVLIVSLEDDADELRRRLRAACLHHGVERSELKGWLFLAAPGGRGGKIMTTDQHGRPVIGDLAVKLANTIKAHQIDIVSLDPFVKAHSVDENSNSLIDEVVQILSDLAGQFDIAVDVPHHAAKGPADPGNPNRGRGASSMKDAGRLVYTLTTMSPEEARALGLSEAHRRSLIRMDSAKVNIAPPTVEAKWFRIVGVDIGNRTDLYPNGDRVQTVEPWSPPDIFEGLSTMLLNQILTDIEAGAPDGNRYTDAPNAFDRAAWRVIVKHCPDKGEAAARRIIRTWTMSGLLVRKNYENPSTRKTVSGFWIDPVKRPS
ncbi:AAA family ATPase [Bradyrhizobium sp. 157]|uniref:AAA family ATPase n=1 Tax=Bradyrhizobium sp. 157 TaxID=2782631 RepID=UPI001FF7EA64|nr:AAA family ATPase [Bradyrhizobium sp. 157]MCK1638965.1 AAA family ATPase [Bradyrhizobium sp. 157]